MIGSQHGSGSSSTQWTSPLQNRISSVPGDRALLSLLIVLIVGVPTIFLRTTFTTFDVPQLTLLWVLAVAVTLVGTYRVLVTGVMERGPLVLTVTSVAFLAALVITSVLSDQPWVAFTGLTVRGAGAVTYGLCLGLLHAVYRLGRRQSLQPLMLAFAGTHGLVVLYALLQAYGLDPFVWGNGELYIGPVFSTLGNANFSSGYVGLTLPILTWVAFGSRTPIVLRAVAGAGIGSSSVALAHLNSFQGDVAALAAVVVVGHWAWLRGRRERLAAVIIVLPVVIVIVGVPLAFDAPATGVLLVLVAVLGFCAGLGAWWDQCYPVEVGAVSDNAVVESARMKFFRERPWLRLAVALGAIPIAVILFGGRIIDQLESGLEQRVAFWRTALSIFLSSPIAGKGLETYPAHFTAYRPVSHAVNYEFVLSDSPHSVPLGLLSGGGLVLGATYVALAVVITRAGVMSLRRADGPERLLYGAVLAAWVAYHVQSSVSMDMPGLIYTQWILGGILLVGRAEGNRQWALLPWAPGRIRSPSLRRRNIRWRMVALALPVVGVLALLLDPLTAPVRADLAAYRAQQALDRADYQAAGEEMLRAIDLQPQNGFYAEGMALVYEESDLFDRAFEERVRSARLRPGNPYVAVQAARAAILVDRMDIARDWYGQALVDDPSGGWIRSEATEFLSEFGG